MQMTKRGIEYTLEEVIEKVNTEFSYLNIEIIDDQYQNSYTKMKVRCKICKYEFRKSLSSSIMGNQCPKCVYKIRKIPHQLDLKKVTDLVSTKYKNLNLEVIDGKYIDRETPMKVKYKICNNIPYKIYVCIVAGAECWKCSYNKRENLLKMQSFRQRC